MGKVDVNEADLFDSFRVATTIHGRYYSETHAVLGRTYGVCVLQDFEALTPIFWLELWKRLRAAV